MYEIVGDFTSKYFNYADPTIRRDLETQLDPPASPCIKKSCEGIFNVLTTGKTRK
jgi:hypothetical protein